ncbi:MAG: hypothetical protein MSG77_02360 [Prevotella sp.]|nr:hypothetical protein [Prevotella sp.]
MTSDEKKGAGIKKKRGLNKEKEGELIKKVRIFPYAQGYFSERRNAELKRGFQITENQYKNIQASPAN